MPIDIALPIGNGEIRPPARPRQAPPDALVIFGATGDLASRKFVPALFDLQQAGLLARRFAVLGFSRSALSDEDFRESSRQGVQQFARHKPVDERAWQEFSAALHYQRGQFDDPSSYRQLADRLAQIDREHGTAGNRLF
jgi:glucose-6-phosphate 1-dehydrogenase